MIYTDYSLFIHHMKHLTVGIASSTLLFAAMLVAAPSALAQSTSTPSVAGSVTKVADVNFNAIGVSYSTSTRAISATGFIRNTMGDISNAVFGLELSGKDAVDAAYSTQHFSLKEGGTTSQDATLVIPKNISGAVSVLAVVKTLGGITIAAEPVWSGTVVSTLSGSDPLSCRQGGSSSVSCTVAKGQYGLTYTVYENALGGRDRLPVADTNAGGKTVKIPADALPPGNYAVLIHLTDAQGAVLSAREYDIFVPGSQGSINTFILQAQQAGTYLITATTQASASTTNFTLTFQGMRSGASCGAPLTVNVTSSVTQTSFSPGCDADTVTATLAADGQPLATASAYIFTKPSGFGPWAWPTVAVILLIILGLVAYAMRRKPVAPPPPPPPPSAPANPITYA